MNKRILFLIIFVLLGILAFQLPINKIIGSEKSFTFFELMGPVGGMFLGPVFGGVCAGLVYVFNSLILHKAFNFLTFALIFPPVLAATYFGIKSKKTAIIFPIFIILFLLNPIGREAWMYSAIWLIPFFATFKKDNLFFNSLGATFAAHGLGSVIYLYIFGLTPAIWMALIPVVFLERGMFTLGIFATTKAFSFVLDKVSNFEHFSWLKTYVVKAN